MRRLFLVFCLMLLLGIKSEVLAGGISTTFGDVYIENLQIGNTYNTKELINLPLRVKNDSEYEIYLKVEVIVPSKQNLKEGFEPIPQPTWISFERSTFTIVPGGVAETNVFITIPKDKKLRGKQFQVYLHSYTVPRPGKALQISVGLASRLLFTIAEKETTRKKNNIGIFQVKPDNLFLIDIPVGKKVDVWEHSSKCLTIYNPNKVQCLYKIESISLKKADTVLRKGFEETPNPGYLTFSEKSFKVPPRSSKNIFLYLNIPDKPKTREKNFMFLVRVRQLTGRIKVKVYSRVYVMTR